MYRKKYKQYETTLARMGKWHRTWHGEAHLEDRHHLKGEVSMSLCPTDTNNVFILML